MSIFKIHPSIGIARLGNSDDFYLAPEVSGSRPTQCDNKGVESLDANGNPIPVSKFKEKNNLSKLKRQAARFKIFHYSDESDKQGQELKIGESYEIIHQTGGTAPTRVKAVIKDINWTVHLANKKASWYKFQETNGQHGYSSAPQLRNPTITQPDKRRQLIIDPGPQTVSLSQKNAQFTLGQNPGYPQTFPPQDTKPYTISTLGELIANEQCYKDKDEKTSKHGRLIVLGGRGHSGSTQAPIITSFVNNDSWFDDISDGPVTASIRYEFTQEGASTSTKGTMDVQVPAWVVVGYPRYIPEMEDMITHDEAMYDLFVREMNYDPQVFGVPPYDKASNNPTSELEQRIWKNGAQYNPDYYPKFHKDIAPILTRPNTYGYTFEYDFFAGGDPHNTGTGGNLDLKALGKTKNKQCDEYKQARQFVYSIMRGSEQVNEYYRKPNPTQNKNLSAGYSTNKPRLMPMLCGNNPITNTSPDKFLAMTKTQLFFLKQWADGKFINEQDEWDTTHNNNNNNNNNPSNATKPPLTGTEIDRGVLSNMLGGAFCPGGELSWIIENPAIYSEPYRINHALYMAGQLSLPKVIADTDDSPAANISAGMEPGDLTKYIGIPWQADFHECTTQDIDVTYENWNTLDLESTGDPASRDIAKGIPWWPAHRPIVVSDAPNSAQTYWSSGLPPNYAGDLQMVSSWMSMGFLTEQGEGAFYQVERDSKALGEPIVAGNRILGQTTNVTSSAIAKNLDRSSKKSKHS